MLFISFVISWQESFCSTALYGPENVLARVVRVVVDHFLIIAFLPYMNMTLSRSWKIMAIYYVLLFVFLSLERLFLRRVVQNLRIRRRDIVNVVIVGDGDNLKEIAEKMQVPFMGYNLIGVFSDKELVGFPAGVIKLGNCSRCFDRGWGTIKI